MSEVPNSPETELLDIAHSLATEFNTRPVESSARFKMAKESSVDVFIQDLESKEKHRFIIAKESEQSRSFYDKLHEAGIAQFKRTELARDSDICVYELPIHAKPLPHEQFVVERASSETHVSDEELFWQLGAIWSVIYGQTKRLPSNPMKATALLNTEDVENALIPIPPYDDWKQRYDSDEAVARTFVSTVEHELHKTHPDIDAHILIEAVQAGWGR